MENKEYSPLTEQEFYENFKKYLSLGEKDDFIFTTRAYYQSDNVVAIYENEGKKHCYFQLPNYKTKLIPHDRRYIYYLPENSVKELSKGKAPDGRDNIEVSKLIPVVDPYTNKEILEKAGVIVDEKKEFNIFTHIKTLSKSDLVNIIQVATTELLTR